MPQSINSKTSINKINAQPTRTYTPNYQHIRYYRTKTKTLKFKLTILKFSSFSTTPTIRLKPTPKINRAKYQNNETTI